MKQIAKLRQLLILLSAFVFSFTDVAAQSSAIGNATTRTYSDGLLDLRGPVNLSLDDTNTTKSKFTTYFSNRIARQNGRLWVWKTNKFVLLDSVPAVDTTFLSARIDARVPYTGATANLNLGTYNIVPNSIQYSASPLSTTLQNQAYWDAGNHTVSINVDSAAGVSLQLGQEQYVRAVNKTGVTIPNGSVVYINGAQGNRPTIMLAQADSVSTSSIIGVATQNIANNAEGFVTTLGVVNGVNTTSYTEGDNLYLSATTAGGLTTTAPSSPYFTTFVATALNSTVNGSIFVRTEQPLADDTLLSSNSNRVSPSQKAVKTYVDKRVKYTDTATMLAPYLRKADTASLSNRINAKQDAITLTTTGTSGAATLIGSTLNIPNYATGSGTVTSIATTNGTGITGGTITTSGTLAIDTTLISTRSWRKKGDDSLGALIGAKVNYSDTASMLTNYVRSASNGITKTGQNVALGGALTGATTITTTGTNTLAVAGLQSGTTNDSVVVADATSGVLKRISSSRIGGGSGWSLTGNAGTTAGTNFVGTTDAQDFVIKRNGTEAARFYGSTCMAAAHRTATIGTNNAEVAMIANFASTLGSNIAQSGIFGGALNSIASGVSFSGIFGGYNNNITTSASQIMIMGSQNTGSGNYNTIMGNYLNSNAKDGVTLIGDNYNSTISADRNNYVAIRGFNGIDIFKDNATKTARFHPSTATSTGFELISGFLKFASYTGTAAEALSPKVEGGVIYSTDGSGTTITSKGLWLWDGSTWVKL